MNQVLFHQGVAHGIAFGLAKGAGHGPTDKDAVHPVQEVVQEAELAGDLGPSGNEHERPVRVAQGLAQVAPFILDQEARGGSADVLNHSGDRGVRAVDHPEGVVDEDIRQAGQLPAEFRIVVRFPGMKSQVLQKENPPGLHIPELAARFIADAVRGELDIASQKLAQAPGHGLQGKLGNAFPLGLAHVGADNRLARMLQEILQCGKCGPYPAVVLNAALLEGDIQVQAEQNGLAFQVELIYKGHNGLLGFWRGFLPPDALMRHASRRV